MTFAVIDTNVIVSALITKNHDSATVKVYEHVLSEDITPLYNDKILSEYRNVLSRKKFCISQEVIETMIAFVIQHGLYTERLYADIEMPDEKDRVFYEISLSKDDSFLVTGNLKHFPVSPKVVSPAEFVRLMGF